MLNLEAKIQRVGSSTRQVAEYTRKLRLTRYLMNILVVGNFQVMYLSGRDTTTGIIYDFQKGGSYLTNSKQQGTKLVDRIPLQALKAISLNFQGQVHTISECPSEVLQAFVEQYTEVDNIKPKQWDDLFMRWRIINFLIDDGALEVQNTMLVEVQEVAPAEQGA